MRPATRRSARRGALVGLLAVLLGAGLPVATSSSAAEPEPGDAGTDTSLPLTDSAVTVTGEGEFEDLEVTVNQTEALGNQAISITWTGGVPTVRAGGAAFAEHYLQIMQCWSAPGSGGPVPEQCVFGATDGVFGGRNGGLFPGGSFADDRVIARGDFESFDPADGFLEPSTNWQWMPFRSVAGDQTDAHVDSGFSPSVSDGEYWLNPLFNSITTNEIVGGRTRPDGTGEELFEVLTGKESPGLGCGQARIGDGANRQVPDCWLVIVPRGAAASENADTIDGSIWEGGPGVMTSPLAPSAWADRIAVPLRFNPVDSPCSLDADQRAVVGSELPLRAVSSWQPVLCGELGLPPYAYAPVSDTGARLQIVSGAFGAPGMAITSRPLNPSAARATNPVAYAPLTLSGLAIGFNIERIPDAETAGPDSELLAGVRVAELNLTPRLVAKLLTQSYQSQLNIAGIEPGAGFEWVEGNPRHLDDDPDFLRFNPEFELLRPQNTKNFGGLVLPSGTSDAVRQLWEWVLADPEARAWLDGEPDEFGMAVNPIYATTGTANASGLPFGDPVPETFPKGDPHCYQAPNQGPGGLVQPPILCGTDWLPYAGNLREAAQRTRAANDGARTTLNPEAQTAARVWRVDGPQRLGTRTILSVVDTTTAAQFGLQTAALSRAGDNGDDRQFVEATPETLQAAAAAMVPSAEPAVRLTDPRAVPAGAYPLSTLTYAQVAPLSIDAAAREDYAAFVEYAVGPGQEPGLEVGQLPTGYAPLPADLVAQAQAAAVTIRTLQSTTTPPPTVPAAPGSPGPAAPAGRPASSGVGSPPTSGPVAAVNAPPVVTGAVTTPSGDEVAALATTPILSAGGRRYVLPAIGALALLAVLAALEITKRPRRSPGPPGAAAAVVVLAVALGLAAGGADAAHAQVPVEEGDPTPVGAPSPDLGTLPPDAPIDAGSAVVVDANGDPIDGGGSATRFSFAPEEPVACSGDSANEGFLVYSFMVPASVAAADVTYDGTGPTPQVYERYEDFRTPLYDERTTDFSARFTAEQDVRGEPGQIVDIPLLSFGVYRRGELPLGDYRIGMVCTLFAEIDRYWDNEITVYADEDDPEGYAWRVTGDQGAAGGTGTTDASGVPAPAVGAVAVVAAIGALAIRNRRRSPALRTHLEK